MERVLTGVNQRIITSGKLEVRLQVGTVAFDRAYYAVLRLVDYCYDYCYFILVFQAPTLVCLLTALVPGGHYYVISKVGFRVPPSSGNGSSLSRTFREIFLLQGQHREIRHVQVVSYVIMVYSVLINYCPGSLSPWCTDGVRRRHSASVA